MPLNRYTSNVASVLDQLEILRTWPARFSVIERKSAQRFAFAVEQWARPNRTNSIRRHMVAIKFPGGVGEDVSYIHRRPPINCGTARATLRADHHSSYTSTEPGQTRRRCAIELFFVLVGQPDRAEHSVSLRFDQLSNDREHFGERRAGKNQFLQVEDRLDRKQLRL